MCAIDYFSSWSIYSANIDQCFTLQAVCPESVGLLCCCMEFLTFLPSLQKFFFFFFFWAKLHALVFVDVVVALLSSHWYTLMFVALLYHFHALSSRMNTLIDSRVMCTRILESTPDSTSSYNPNSFLTAQGLIFMVVFQPLDAAPALAAQSFFGFL